MPKLFVPDDSVKRKVEQWVGEKVAEGASGLFNILAPRKTIPNRDEIFSEAVEPAMAWLNKIPEEFWLSLEGQDYIPEPTAVVATPVKIARRAALLSRLAKVGLDDPSVLESLKVYRRGAKGSHTAKMVPPLDTKEAVRYLKVLEDTAPSANPAARPYIRRGELEVDLSKQNWTGKPIPQGRLKAQVIPEPGDYYMPDPKGEWRVLEDILPAEELPEFSYHVTPYSKEILQGGGVLKAVSKPGGLGGGTFIPGVSVVAKDRQVAKNIAHDYRRLLKAAGSSNVPNDMMYENWRMQDIRRLAQLNPELAKNQEWRSEVLRAMRDAVERAKVITQRRIDPTQSANVHNVQAFQDYLSERASTLEKIAANNPAFSKTKTLQDPVFMSRAVNYVEAAKKIKPEDVEIFPIHRKSIPQDALFTEGSDPQNLELRIRSQIPLGESTKKGLKAINDPDLRFENMRLKRQITSYNQPNEYGPQYPDIIDLAKEDARRIVEKNPEVFKKDSAAMWALENTTKNIWKHFGSDAHGRLHQNRIQDFFADARNKGLRVEPSDYHGAPEMVNYLQMYIKRREDMYEVLRSIIKQNMKKDIWLPKAPDWANKSIFEATQQLRIPLKGKF